MGLAAASCEEMCRRSGCLGLRQRLSLLLLPHLQLLLLYRPPQRPCRLSVCVMTLSLPALFLSLPRFPSRCIGSSCISALEYAVSGLQPLPLETTPTRPSVASARPSPAASRTPSKLCRTTRSPRRSTWTPPSHCGRRCPSFLYLTLPFFPGCLSLCVCITAFWARCPHRHCVLF